MSHPTCPTCSGTLPRKSNGQWRKYCSEDCCRKALQITSSRTCTVDDCDKMHLAKGYCKAHYRKAYRNRQAEYHQCTCATCGQTFQGSRPNSKYCTDQCKGDAYRRKCKLPADHPVLLLMAQRDAEARAEAKARREAARLSAYEWRTERQCPGCACWFTPLYTPNAICCSKPCVGRVHRRRRRARERGARGSFTWAEFMRIAKKFDYCCAYCGTRPDRLDPDHVVPLSRGGSDSPSNLLPTCFMCNSSKCAMTLPEWSKWRRERDMEPRKTEWEPGDPRYTHLTEALLVAAAA